MNTVVGSPISPDFYYNARMLDAAGIGAKTLQKWRRAGMQVRYVGRSLWIQGSEVVRMIDETGAAERWDTSAK